MDVILNKLFHTGQSNDTQFPSYIKNKIYLSVTDNQYSGGIDMYCWDITSSSECSEFSGGMDWASLNSSLYTDTKDYSY